MSVQAAVQCVQAESRKGDPLSAYLQAKTSALPVPAHAIALDFPE